MNLSRPFISPPGRDDAADDRRRARRHFRVHEAAGRAVAAGRFPDHFGAGARCRARARRPWRPASPAPLERHLGSIADVTEMTSSSSVGSTRITLQFGLNRDIDGAARDVQAAINAARADLPASLRSNPTYHKVNPADAPILILALTSKTLTAGQLYDSAATVLQQSLSQVDGVGEVDVSGSANPAVRVELEPNALSHYGIGLEDVRAALASANANSPKGSIEFGTEPRADLHQRPGQQGVAIQGSGHRLSQRRGGEALRRGRGGRFGRRSAQPRPLQRQAFGAGDSVPPAGREHHRHDRPRDGDAAATARVAARGRRHRAGRRPLHHDPRVAERHRAHAGGRGRAGGAWWCSCSCATGAPR